MSKILVDKVVLEQALEALGSSLYPQPRQVAAIAALRAALAEPVQEPVAWMVYTEGGTSAYVTDNPNDLVGAYRALPLYAAPPQRKPLTEEEMYIVEEEARKNFRLSHAGPRGQMITYWDSLTPWLIRAVERAHGISE